MTFDDYTLILGGEIQDRERVLGALEKTAQEFGWRFMLEDIYDSGEKEEAKQTATRIYLSNLFSRKVTLKMASSDKIARIDTLRGRGYGFAKDEDTISYLERFSENLHKSPEFV